MSEAAIPEHISLAAKRIINGHIVKYNAEVHIPLLFEVFQAGKDISAFCVASGISRNTFHAWVRNHKKFGRAYDEAKELARIHWEGVGEQGVYAEGFNQRQWAFIMRNRFDQTESRKISIPGFGDAKTPKERFELLASEIEEGKITADEANKMGSFVLTGATIDEKTILAQEIEALKQLVEASGLKA